MSILFGCSRRSHHTFHMSGYSLNMANVSKNLCSLLFDLYDVREQHLSWLKGRGGKVVCLRQWARGAAPRPSIDINKERFEL